MSFMASLKNCLNYLCIHQNKLSSNDMSFQDATCDGFPGIGIPEVLMNIMYCCGYAKEENKIIILMFRIKLVSYDLSKGFLTIDPKSDALDSVSLKFKQQIHTIDKYGTDSSILCNRYTIFRKHSEENSSQIIIVLINSLNIYILKEVQYLDISSEYFLNILLPILIIQN